MNVPSTSEFAAFIGIDWADRKHDVCLLAAGSSRREFSVLAHRPEAIAQWAEGLRQRFGAGAIAVCLEIAKGPLVNALQRYPFLVLFPVNPATLAKYRKAFHVSGAKDDPLDAQLALELLLKHPERLKPLQPQGPAMRTLQELVEQRRALIGDVGRLINRITWALKQYFPQVLEWFEDKDTLVFCDFLIRWPTLKHAQRARKARLTAFFHEHNVRYPHLIEQRIRGIASATALTADCAVIEPNRLLVEALVQQLRLLLQSVERFDHEVEALARTLPDFDLFASFPGAGALPQPSVSGASAMAALSSYRNTQASPRSPSAAATSAGCTGAYTARGFSARPSWSSPLYRCRTATGQRPTTSSSAAADPPAKQPCAHSPSNGSASCTAAGRTACPTTRPSI
jgi:transposase